MWELTKISLDTEYGTINPYKVETGNGVILLTTDAQYFRLYDIYLHMDYMYDNVPLEDNDDPLSEANPCINISYRLNNLDIGGHLHAYKEPNRDSYDVVHGTAWGSEAVWQQINTLANVPHRSIGESENDLENYFVSIFKVSGVEFDSSGSKLIDQMPPVSTEVLINTLKDISLFPNRPVAIGQKQRLCEILEGLVSWMESVKETEL